MRAPVPYLARLARQAAGQAALRPPRQLFAGDISLPARLPGREGPRRGRAVPAATLGPAGFLPPSGADEEGAASEETAASRGRDAGTERRTGPAGGPAASVAPAPVTSLPATPAAPARPEPTAGLPTAPGGPDAPWPPRAAPRPPGAARPGPPRDVTSGPDDPAAARPAPPWAATADPGDPAGARAAAWPPGPGSQPASRPRLADDPTGTGPPGSRAGAPRGRPADLPGATGPAPPAGETDAQAGPVARAGTAPAPSGREPADMAGPRPGQRTDDAGLPVARGTAGGPGAPGAEGSADPDRPAEPTAVRHLMPPAADLRPAAVSGSAPGEPYREPRGAGRSQVTIGTIDVTVIPPAAAARPAPPPAPVPSGWSRPGSLLTASAGADRRRDGLRRWYGTAQG
jgi:hypothetical protein